MVATRAMKNMKSFYSYTQSVGVSAKAESDNAAGNGKFVVHLKDIVVSDIDKDISNFYAPDLKFFLFPMVWDESGRQIQCHPQQNLETLADLGNLVLGGNNTRELSDKNQMIFSTDDIQGYLGIILMGIAFDRDTELSKKLITKIKSEIRKSRLNKLVKSIADFDSIDESIGVLFERLTKKIDGITQIYCLANYKSNEKTQSCNSPNPFFLNNDKLNIELEILTEMNLNTKEEKVLSFFDVIPDMNGNITRSSRRSILEKLEIIQPYELLSSSYGRIESLLVTIPRPYLEENKAPYTSYINIIKELAEKLPERQLTLLAETREEQVNDREQTKIDAIKNDATGAELLVLTTTKADDSFSLWVQDAFLVAQPHEATAPMCIIAPKEYQRDNRSNDGSIAEEVVAHHPTGYASINFPTPIEGGNVLVGKDFILVGQDEVLNSGYLKEAFLKKLETVFGTEKPIILVHSKPSPKKMPNEFERHRDVIILSKGKQQLQHDIYRWRGKEQPIFHIDVFMTLLGCNQNHEQIILVGEPIAGFDTKNLDERTQEVLEYQLEDAEYRIQECIQNLENDLNKHNIAHKIIRNPMPLTYYTYGLRTCWYWASYNNCLVEITNENKKTAWLPSYHNDTDTKNTHWQYLEEYDKQNVEKFRENGFETLLFKNDFHFLASRNGSLHCMTKCLNRSNSLRKSQTT